MICSLSPVLGPATARSVLVLILLTGCVEPRPVAEVAFSIPDSALVPEGIAFDPAEGAFYVSSTNRRKIVRVDGDGSVRDFVGPAENGEWGVLGLSVDPERRVLWAASSHAGSGMPMQKMDPAEEGSSGIFKYDLTSGALIRKYLLGGEDGGHFLNDVTVTPKGTVYTTDSGASAIYRIDAERDSLELFLAPPGMPSPNGITWSQNAGVLFVALRGRIGRIRPEERELTYVTLPDGVRANADGLYFYDESLITVWPYEEGRGVTRYRLDPLLETVTSIDSILPDHPAFLQPTTGAIVGEAIYVLANAQLQRHRAAYAGEVEGAQARLVDPVVLRVDLSGRGTR